MALYLVRHGETDWNRDKRFQSTTEVPLNEKGIAQAKAIRDEFRRRGISFCTARCSPLSRAVRTAQIILEETSTAPIVDPSFIEISMGEYEGQSEADLERCYGEAYKTWRRSHYTLAPPGGEDVIGRSERVRPALLKLTQAASTGEVLIVAHQAVNMAMKVALSGRRDLESVRSFRQNNDEVDIWDMAAGRRLEQLRVVLPAGA
ncbi:histidine phosphatase family protein [bacterium]|nr:histidine phosphatase family protein [bacterium]